MAAARRDEVVVLREAESCSAPAGAQRGVPCSKWRATSTRGLMPAGAGRPGRLSGVTDLCRIRPEDAPLLPLFAARHRVRPLGRHRILAGLSV